MKKRLFTILILVVTDHCLNTGLSAAQHKEHHGQAISFGVPAGSEKTVTGCGQVTMKVFDQEIVRGEQLKTLPKSMVSTLWARSARNGGIHVQSWDRDYYEVKACTGAAGKTTAEAERLLSQVSLSFQNGRVNAQGPDANTWMVYLIIRVPKGAVMELEGEKSQIILNALAGTAQVRSVNGPVSLFEVNGKVQAETQNGPIRVEGARGDYRLNARNGPLEIELLGNRWETGKLEGTTENGPLSLSIPAAYKSPVQVEGQLLSRVDCRVSKCRQWGTNLIEFGNGDPVVRLSAIRGPVKINTR